MKSLKLHSKKDFQECLLDLITPVKNYYSDGKALLKCGAAGVFYGEKVACMEGFARILWGLAPLWGGNGTDKEFEQIYHQGLINGTDPKHEEYWGELVDFNQMIVECAPIGLALILAPDKVWDPLSDVQKVNLYNWLSKINEIQCSNNNWNFFKIFVNLGFRQVGAPYNKQVVHEALENVHSFYLGNGWYSDGLTVQMDYYISFALHFYGLIYARVMEKDDPENSRIFKERACIFAKDFIYWFAEDGSSIPFGRSLTYRFAQCCFWSACVYAGIEPFPMDVMKGIIVRHLQWWLDKPILDNGGILSIGYAYPNLNMSEDYNGHGSPYWALKAFLILALEDNHKFFEVEAVGLPELDGLRIIPEARMVIQRKDGHAYALTSGQWVDWLPAHVAEKYSKFIYSTKYGFSTPRSYFDLKNAGTDNMLAFEPDNEKMYFVRRKCLDYRMEADGTIYSKWSPYSGVTVETYLIPTETGHKRCHVVNCEKTCIAYDCGFSGVDVTASILGEGELVDIKCTPNTNVLFPLTQMKGIKYQFSVGQTIVETEIVY